MIGRQWITSLVVACLVSGILPATAVFARDVDAASSPLAVAGAPEPATSSAAEINAAASELDWLWRDDSAGAGGFGVAANGDAYVAGSTGTDIAIRKYDRNGSVVWTKTLGAGPNALGDDVTVDETGVYVAGMMTNGAALPGQTSAGGNDAFVIKTDLNGNVLWRQQWGTTPQQGGSTGSDYASGVATDRSAVYVYGQTTGSLAAPVSGSSDVWVRKILKSGGPEWTYQFGTTAGENAFAGIGVWNPRQTGVAEDAGIYVSITTTGAFHPDSNPSGAHHVAIVKLDLNPVSNGIDWVRQFGAGQLATGEEIGVDEHGAYLVGVVGEALPEQIHAGSIDAYIRAYDHQGVERWTRQLGTPSQDWTVTVATDGAGIYIGGYTDGSLPAQTNAGGFDAYLVKYLPNGTATQLRQFGTAQNDRIIGLGVDVTGCYATGISGTTGFAAKLNNIPAPPRHWVEEEAAPSEAEPPSQDPVKSAEYQGDPVNVLFGNFTYQHTDLALPGVGLPVSMTRTYNSARPRDGLLGYGWSLSYSLSVAQVRPGLFEVRRGDGRIDLFLENGGTLEGPPGSEDALTRAGDGTFTLATPERITYRFHPVSHSSPTSGRLLSASDPDGNELTFEYDGSGRWTSLKDAASPRRTWLIAYAGTRISSITDPAGRTVSYGYSGAGDLTSVTDVLGNVTSFQYDTGHRITRITDPRGKLFVEHTYDAEGRVVTQTDAAGTYTFAYLPHKTVVTDPLGKTTTTEFDSFHRVTRVINALGGIRTMTYNADGLLASITDEIGRTTTYTYDARGNVATITDPTGAVTTMTYDTRNNLLTVTDHLGRTTTNTYDGEDHLTSTKNALNQTTQFTYTPAGLLASVTDPLGHATSYAYDARGYQTSVTNALSASTAYVYNAAGQPTKVTDPLAHHTNTTYDAMGRVLTITAADGGQTKLTYDASGNTTSTTDARGNVTTFAYDNANRMISSTNALAQKTTFGYDALGRQTTRTLPNGRVWRSAYDALGRLKTQTSPLGFVTSYTYDAAGQLTSVTDALGNQTSYEYDLAGRLTKVTEPLATITNLRYDAVGNLTRVTDARGNQTNMTYDALNRLLTETNPVGGITQTAYDAAGRVASSQNAAGQVANYTYDDANRLLTMTVGTLRTTYAYDAAGRRTSMSHGTVSGSQHVVSYTYDVMDRIKSVTSPQGTVGYAYDLAGNRTSLSQPGLIVSYTYDKLNRVLTVKRPASVVTYAYDLIGNVKRQTFGNGVITTHTYDGDGRLTKLVSKKGTVTRLNVTYVLDKLGRRTKETSTGFAGTYGYDALSRLTSAVHSVTTAGGATSAINVSLAWTYDKSGNRLTETRNGATTSYTYDAANRLATAGARSFTYDAAGRLTADGLATYSYDSFSRLREVVRGATTTSFTYDGDGNRLTERTGATTTTYLLDTTAANPVRIAATTGGTVQRFVYGLTRAAHVTGGTTRYEHSDGLGSVRLLTSSTGAVSGRQNFEAFGTRLNGTGTFGFAGEPYSNGGKLVHLRAREYDPATGRFLTPDPHSSDPTKPHTINRYQYVGNNPVNAIDPSGRWSYDDSELRAIDSQLMYHAGGCGAGDKAACAELAFWSDVAYTYHVLIDWEREGLKLSYEEGMAWLGVSFDYASEASYYEPQYPVETHAPPASAPVLPPAFNGANGLISDNGSAIIARDSAGLISDNSSAIIARDSAGLISDNGSAILSDQASGLISDNSSALIGLDGSTMRPRMYSTMSLPMGAESSNNKLITGTSPGF